MYGSFAIISVNLRNRLFFVPFTKNGIFKLTKCGISPKVLCILRSVTRIMVKKYNCSCNRNMYLWWCSNVYKRFQSFIWRYFLLCLSYVLSWDWQQYVAWGGEIWLYLYWNDLPVGREFDCKFLKKVKSPPHALPPPPPRRHYIDRCIMQTLDFVSGLHNCLEFCQPLSCLYQAM